MKCGDYSLSALVVKTTSYPGLLHVYDFICPLVLEQIDKTDKKHKSHEDKNTYIHTYIDTHKRNVKYITCY